MDWRPTGSRGQDLLPLRCHVKTLSVDREPLTFERPEPRLLPVAPTLLFGMSRSLLAAVVVWGRGHPPSMCASGDAPVTRGALGRGDYRNLSVVNTRVCGEQILRLSEMTRRFSACILSYTAIFAVF